MNSKNININDKGLKKLDLNSIKSIRNEVNSSFNYNKNEKYLSSNNNQKEKVDKEIIEIFLDKVITKDYEQYMEFVSQEDYFADKFVNLQNPYLYIPVNQKREQSTKNELINKYVKDKDVIVI